MGSLAIRDAYTVDAINVFFYFLFLLPAFFTFRPTSSSTPGELLFFYFMGVLWILLDGAWLLHHNGYTIGYGVIFINFFFFFGGVLGIDGTRIDTISSLFCFFDMTCLCYLLFLAQFD
jgi:hypothetical protein